jgi:DNA-binding GntR family transcriptional regulator
MPSSNDMMEKLSRTTTAKDVADILRRRILNGKYLHDRFIRQELIANELGVSRIPVREALAQLENEGLVVRHRYRGAMVPKLSAEEIQEIYALRSMIEPYLLQHAVGKISAGQIAVLRDIIARARAITDVAEWTGLNVEFHRTLYQAAEKPLTLQILDNLLVRADRYLKLQTFRIISTKDDSDDEHEKLLNLIEARDVDGAVAALHSHISLSADDANLVPAAGPDEASAD